MDILTLKKATNESKQHISRGIIFPPKITEMPVVTFISDDGRVEDYTLLKPLFDEYNIPFAVAITTNNIDKGGYLTKKQLLELNESGVEILSHTKSHARLDQLSEDDAEEELRGSQQALKEIGLNVEHIVYPYGRHSRLVRKLARKYYRSGYLFNNTGGLNTQPYNTYMLERIALGAYFDNPTDEYPVTNTFEDYYKKIVDKAVAQKAWLIITLHPGAASGEFTETQQSYLVQTIQYIKSLNVPVLNPSEVLDSMGNVVDIAAYDQSNSKEVLFQIGANGRIVSDIVRLLDGAGFHNSIYRGKFLGNEVTSEQWDRIADGTFRDMYIGDYWTIDGTTYLIAAFNYYYNTGDTRLTTNHVTLVPAGRLYTHRMNPTNTTEGGYVGSEMYTTGLDQAKAKIHADFSGHVLTHRRYLCNTVADGQASAGAWFDSDVELMNEVMVFGSVVNGKATNGTYNIGTEKSQLPLFALRPDLLNIRVMWWLRDVCSATAFATVESSGFGGPYYPSAARGVRPVFSISA